MLRFAYSSVPGTYHTASSSGCQDTSRVEVVREFGQDIVIAVASDGAGSASLSSIGSSTACEMFIGAVKQFLLTGNSFNLPDSKFISAWIDSFQIRIGQRAEYERKALNDYACTLLAVVAGEGQAAYFQLGDGAIVVSGGDGDYSCICAPQQGEYVNSTNFLTDINAKEKIFYTSRSSQNNEIALFTDGIQNLVLDNKTGAPHSPFFTPLFVWLRSQPNNNDTASNLSLATYLNSDRINSRTDDDKTLILIVRD